MSNESNLSRTMPKRSDRLQIPALGEYYGDLLTIDARINARTEPQQANSLLCSKLQEREQRIRDRVGYLADKRGKSFEDMWDELLTGDFEPLSPDEYKVLREQLQDEAEG